MKSPLRAFRRDGGHGALTCWADTWLAEMGVQAEEAAVDGRRKEDAFQVGWMMLSMLIPGHSVMRLGRVTPQDSSLEERWY